MNSAKMKAIMKIVNDMDDDMLSNIDLKGKMDEMPKPDVKITKVAVLPKPEIEESEEEETEDNSDTPSLKDMLPKEGDEDDVLAKLRKKFQGK